MLVEVKGLLQSSVGESSRSVPRQGDASLSGRIAGDGDDRKSTGAIENLRIEFDPALSIRGNICKDPSSLCEELVIAGVACGGLKPRRIRRSRSRRGGPRIGPLLCNRISFLGKLILVLSGGEFPRIQQYARMSEHAPEHLLGLLPCQYILVLFVELHRVDVKTRNSLPLEHRGKISLGSSQPAATLSVCIRRCDDHKSCRWVGTLKVDPESSIDDRNSLNRQRLGRRPR